MFGAYHRFIQGTAEEFVLSEANIEASSARKYSSDVPILYWMHLGNECANNEWPHQSANSQSYSKQCCKFITADEESQYNRDSHFLICNMFFVSKGNIFYVYYRTVTIYFPYNTCTLKFQRLENRWLVYRGWIEPFLVPRIFFRWLKQSNM